MISLISICHRNIGDAISSKFLKGYLETYTRDIVEIVSYDDPYIASSIQKSNIVIVGTGGMFGSFHNRPVFDFRYDSIGVPLIVLCSGFNFGIDLYGHVPEFYNKTKELFDRAIFVGLRTELDCVSAGYFCDEGKITLSPSPLHFCGYDSIGNYIGFSPCFNMSYIHNIVAQSRCRFIEHESFTTTPIEYSNLKCVVTGRFHGAVLSSAFGTPFFTIVSNHKHKAINRMFYGEDKNTYCYYHEQNLFENRFNKFLSNLDYYRNITIKKREQLRKCFFESLLKVEKLINV